MALVIADRVRETTSSVGTGAVALTGAFLGFQSFSVIGDGNTTYYGIIDTTAGTWEVGVGTYTAAGSTLSRDTVLSSSNGGALVSFSAGVKDVICTQPAARAVFLDSATNTTIPGATISGGTANGVTYLNGSKELTSGGVLTYDGLNLVLASGNLGVGTSSPDAKLDVRGSFTQTTATAQASTTVLGGITNVSNGYEITNDGSDNLTYSWRNGANGTAMRLNSSGNLGLGISPSAWGSSTLSLSMAASGAAFMSSRTDEYRLNLGLNAYDIGSDAWRYAATAPATRYAQLSGAHQWFNAPSGTVGNAISFTQAMTLDASGNLGIGNSSPTAKLDVTGTAAISGAVTLSGGTANGVAYLNGSKVLTTGSALTYSGGALLNTGSFAPTDGTNIAEIKINAATLDFNTSSTVVPQVFRLGSAEQMRLTSTGLGIGTSSPAAKLDVKGGTTISTLAGWNTLSNSMFELANPAVRFGIGYDSSDQVLLQGFDTSNGARNIGMQVYGGNVGIGTSSPANKLHAYYPAALTVSAEATYAARFSNNSNKGVIIGYDSTNNVGHIGSINPTVAWTDLVLNANGGNVGIGTSSPAAKLDVIGNIGVQSPYQIRFNGGADAAQSIRYNTTLDGLQMQGFAGLAFLTGSGSGTERMRLDASGNLGIGTSSPSNKLSVSTSTYANAFVPIQNLQYSTFDVLKFGFTGFTGSIVNGTIDAGTYGLSFNTGGGTERMRIDSAGNLGLGVTPSAWNSDYKAIQLGANGGIAGRVGGSNTTDVVSNTFRDSGGAWRYIASSGVSRYTIDGSTSAHIWYTAPSGTAGNAISFTQAMTLNASGNLLVGTTSNQTGAKVNAAGGVGTSNPATERFATVEYGSGASGSFTTITISFTVNSNVSSVILETLMTGFPGVYLDHVAAQYSNQAAVVIRNNASAGTTVASLAVDGATTTYTLTITTSVTHPVVKVKATVGGLGGTTTLPTITFA